MSPVIVWTKPVCGQCTAVKLHLKKAGVAYDERDITAPENAKQLDYFRGLGYLSAPITEFRELAVPGFIPAEIDQVVERWREAQASETTS